MNSASVLVVEDDPYLRDALKDVLSMAKYNVLTANDGQEALKVLSDTNVELVLSDVQMEPLNGHELLRKLKTEYPNLPVILMTAYGTIQTAVEAMRDGASDYLVKPFDSSILVKTIMRYILPKVSGQGDLDFSNDNKMSELIQLAMRVAKTEATVMITGESGTGKEVIARYIHAKSARAEQPFVAINCAAIPENMLEAVLFGYEKGAFTGAYNTSPGKFEQAQHGTLLLDEISEMNLSLQAKLLRVLQEKEVERLGGRKTISLDVRVLATSNRNMREEVFAGRFREDLFYRLNVFPLHLPPLRQRKADILQLALKLMARHIQGAVPPSLTDNAKQKLMAYHWPGNVRELDNVIQRAVILSSGAVIDGEHLHFEECQPNDSPVYSGQRQSETAGPLGEDLKSREFELILEALRAAEGNRKQAADKLGISQRTLRYKLARMRDEGIDIP